MSNTEQELLKQAKISFEEAREIAVEKVPGQVFNWEIEREKKRIVFSIEIQLANDKKYSREVNVDAETGKILGVEKENLSEQLKAADRKD